MTLKVTPDTLNAVMEFDHVIRVHADGTVTEPTDVHAPDVYLESDGAMFGLDRTPWNLLDGYSGQDRYRGPWMHSSEYIGGRMAKDILATPGLYVAIYPTYFDDSEPDTWAVAYILDES